MNSEPHDDALAEEARYRGILTSIVKRFVRLVGAPEALGVARKIPELLVDTEGNVLSYDRDDPLSTINLLIEQYETLFGEAGVTLAHQAARPTTSLPVSSPAPTPLIKALLVDSHALFREGLASLLDSHHDVKVMGGASNVREAVEMARTLKPNLVLTDYNFQDGTGLDVTKAVLAQSPQTIIVFLSIYDDDERLFAAVRAGALGYLPKNLQVTELLKTLRGMVRGEAGISRVIARRILEEFSRLPALPQNDPFREAELTPRELELLHELARGATNHEIAKRLVISENTVRNHVHNVLAKLRLHSRRDVIDYVSSRGPANHLAKRSNGASPYSPGA